jgi:hypothetical protein
MIADPQVAAGRNLARQMIDSELQIGAEEASRYSKSVARRGRVKDRGA